MRISSQLHVVRLSHNMKRPWWDSVPWQSAVPGTGCEPVPALPLLRAVFVPLLWRSAPQPLKAKGTDRLSPAGLTWPKGRWQGRVFSDLDPPALRVPYSGGCTGTCNRRPALLTESLPVPLKSPGCAFSVQDTEKLSFAFYRLASCPQQLRNLADA